MSGPKKFRLRNLKITRVDTVDNGANPDAHIAFTKRADDIKWTTYQKEKGVGYSGVLSDSKKKRRKKTYKGTGTAFPEKMAADVSKHGGPGGHSGTGSPQSAHAGGGGAAGGYVYQGAHFTPEDAANEVSRDFEAQFGTHAGRMDYETPDEYLERMKSSFIGNNPDWDSSEFPRSMSREEYDEIYKLMKKRVAKAGLPASPTGAPKVAAAPAGPRRVASAAPSRAVGGGSASLPSSPTPTAPQKPTDYRNPNSRLSTISPGDFQAMEGKNGTTEWFIPPESLPEGVEEAVITMVPSADAPTFQWMVDPLAGPPIDGVAKTAAEAFMAMRSALTQSSVANTELTGPLSKPASKPRPKPSNPNRVFPSKMDMALAKADVDSTLEVIAKGLVESGVFIPSTTGSELRAILSPEVIDELANVTKSADTSAGYQEVPMAGELEALVEQLPEEVLEYIGELESQVADLSKRLESDKEPAAEEGDPIAKALSTLDPEVAELFKSQSSRLEEAEKALASERIAKANTAWIAKARDLDAVVDDADAFGQVLRQISDHDPALATAVESVLKAANERVEKGALFSELGHGSGLSTDLDDQVAAIAKAFNEADPKMSEEEARAQVWLSNPELYAKHVEEQRQRARAL